MVPGLELVKIECQTFNSHSIWWHLSSAFWHVDHLLCVQQVSLCLVGFRVRYISGVDMIGDICMVLIRFISMPTDVYTLEGL